jgi:hypothetical protein
VRWLKVQDAAREWAGGYFPEDDLRRDQGGEAEGGSNWNWPQRADLRGVHC